ncbi:MAG: hypothetical protein MUC56_15150 [Thermoanaerobaculales bacterium]|jgi:hypothetical protein|nr:hypothetical protein [Thermoanaerobaculales bacterium]
MRNGWFRVFPAVVLLAALASTGCTHIGPQTVAVDRFDYSTAIADSWKQQTLLNIVKMRYVDLPVFVDVANVVSGYSLQTGVSATGVLSSERAVQGNYASIGGQAIYTDRPTITYVPLTGEKFLYGMITPIDPKKIFFMLQTGFAADFILGLTVESLNGVQNRSAAGGVVRAADPDFMRALELIRDIQVVGAFGMRVEEDEARGSTGVVFFRRDDVPVDVAAKAAEVRRLLKLAPDQQRFVLTYSPVRGADDELAVNSRSMLQILSAFASYVEVPAAHLEDRSAVAPLAAAAGASSDEVVRIHSGTQEPANAYAAIRYRDHWFWIDNGDWQTKRALTAVMFFFTLAGTGAGDNLPLVTIPAQ